LLFITLAKFKGKPSKESISKADKLFAKMAEDFLLDQCLLEPSDMVDA